MLPASVSSFDAWNLEEAAETVLHGNEAEAAGQVASRLPSPPGRPQPFGPEPYQ